MEKYIISNYYIFSRKYVVWITGKIRNEKEGSDLEFEQLNSHKEASINYVEVILKISEPPSCLPFVDKFMLYVEVCSIIDIWMTPPCSSTWFMDAH